MQAAKPDKTRPKSARLPAPAPTADVVARGSRPVRARSRQASSEQQLERVGQSFEATGGALIVVAGGVVAEIVVEQHALFGVDGHRDELRGAFAIDAVARALAVPAAALAMSVVEAQLDLHRQLQRAMPQHDGVPDVARRRAQLGARERATAARLVEYAGTRIARRALHVAHQVVDASALE